MTDQLDEALETWEAYLAGVHTCDFGEPEAVAILHINEAARLVADGQVIPKDEMTKVEWCADHGEPDAWCRLPESPCNIVPYLSVPARLWLDQEEE